MSAPGAASLVNLRDVGGLPATDGGRVAPGQLYRSAAPLPGDAEPDLRPWPPRTVVDLRATGEAATATHPLAQPATEVIALPLTRELDPARMAAHEPTGHVDLEKVYAGVVRALGPRLVEVVAVIAAAPGPVLVHCAAGKDRTGIAVAVTLAGAGVLHEAIVADYLRTEDHADELAERVALGWSPDRREAWLRLAVAQPAVLRAPAGAIEGVLATLASWEGGAAGWLLAHGLAPEALGALRRRLILPPA